MEDYKAELDRRRKRGRLAQSAFRKRQAEAKQNMQEENATLKRAIQAIVNESEVDDRPALRRKIQEAATLAGLDTQNDTIATSSGQEGTSTSSPTQTQTANATTSENINTSSAYSPNQALSFQTSSSSGEHNGSPDTQISYQTSIRPDPFQCHRCTDGVAAVLPFLGSGAFTFAGRVFWYLVHKFEATKHTYSSEHLSRPPTMKQKPSLQFRDLLHQSKSLQNLDTAHWIAMIEARTADRRQHSVISHLDPSSANLLRQTLETQDLARKDAPLKWISPMSLEKRIRAIVGDDVFAMLATPVLARWEAIGRNPGYAMEDSTELLHGLFESLSESFVCFGDGPQWNIETFDRTLRRWCLSIIDTQGLATAR